MSAMQRTKGANGEREVARLLRSALGIEITRNWQSQSSGGGFDLTGVPGWAIEVKRAAGEHKTDWWKQAVTQASKEKLIPALVYRIDGFGRGLEDDEKWQVLIPLYAIFESSCADPEYGVYAAHKIDPPIQMTLRTWIYLLAKAKFFAGVR